MQPSDVSFTEALFQAALGEATREERDDDDYKSAVSYLGKRDGDEVLDLVEPLAEHTDPRLRALVADAVGALFRREDRDTEPGPCLDLLTRILATEDTSFVLTRLGHAFGEIGDPVGARLMAPFARHPDPEVRLAVIEALIVEHGPGPVGTLIALSRDTDERVRDEATFALSTQHESASGDDLKSPLLDTPELRDALAARLDDEHRGIAYGGLVSLRDPRVIPIILAELERGPRPDDEQIFRDAKKVASPLLYAALDALDSTKDRAKRRMWRSLGVEEALYACAPPREPSPPPPPVEAPEPMTDEEWVREQQHNLGLLF